MMMKPTSIRVLGERDQTVEKLASSLNQRTTQPTQSNPRNRPLCKLSYRRYCVVDPYDRIFGPQVEESGVVWCLICPSDLYMS